MVEMEPRRYQSAAMNGREPLPSDARSSGIPSGISFVLPFVVAVAVGLPSVRGTFIRDDWDYVTGNPHVACQAGLKDVFRSSFQPLKPLGLYRPVTTLSLRLDARLGGEERPWIFHATNLLLAGGAAALAALLAWNLARRAFDRDVAARAALVAGLLFAVHPARSEAVCWISGRAENLMTFFALACLALASGPEAVWRTVLAAACAVLAAWSKEQGFALLLVVPVVAPPVSGKRLVQALVVASLLGLAFVLRYGALGGLELKPGIAVFADLGPAERAAQGLRLLFEYARLAVWPQPLLFEYDAAPLRASGFADPRVIGGAVVLAALAAAVALFRRAPLVASGAASFLFPLLPVLNAIMPIGEDFAERFLALPAAGVGLLAAAAAARSPRAGFAAAMALVAAGGVLFTARAADYKSERVLYEALVAKAPASPAAKSLLASSRLVPEGGARRPTARETESAEALLREVIAADPAHAPARVTLGAVEAGRRAVLKVPPLPSDLDFLAETARLFPAVPQTQGMYGRALYERGAWDLARPALERELANMPYDLSAASTLARILESQKETAKADAVMKDVRARWEALWKRFPGFAPVAVTYARALADGAFDVDGARAVLRRSAAAACRPSDRRAIEAALAELGG
jgi:hypothetical protein